VKPVDAQPVFVAPETKSFWKRSEAGKAYDKEFGGTIGRYVDESETRPFRGLFRSLKNSKILDVGCGTGRHLALFDGSNELHGLDLSESMLAEAAVKNPSAKFCSGSADSLPYPDGTFDVVMSSRVLQHLKDQKKAVSEMARVLKPGGRLVLLSYNSWSLLCLYKQVRMGCVGRVLNIVVKPLLGRRSFFNPWGFSYDNYCSVPELSGYMKESGLDVEMSWGATCGQAWFWNDLFIGKLLERTLPFILNRLVSVFLFLDGTAARVFPLKYFTDKIVVAGVKKT
jgi:SAM-dependent methyltransferase